MFVIFQQKNDKTLSAYLLALNPTGKIMVPVSNYWSRKIVCGTKQIQRNFIPYVWEK